MRHVLGAVLVLAVIAGCGPAASIDKLGSDNSGKDPVLQVWCHVKRLEENADIKVVVEWNHNTGTAKVSETARRASDNVAVVNVEQWAFGNSTYDRLNEMSVRFVYDDTVLAQRVLSTPNEFANAFKEPK
jgi:hypothetical protein